MNVKQEIIDSIQVMVDAAIKKVCPIITFGIVVSIGDKNKCIARINNIDYKIVYYGKTTPDLNQKYPIFVPFGKMNLAFIITSGNSEGGTFNYNQLQNLPSINNVILSGNKTNTELNLSSIKYNTTAGWNSQPSLVSENNIIYVYTDYYDIEDGKKSIGVKIGDGNAYLIDLPFVDSGIVEMVEKHISDDEIHITNDERIAWNNKVRCYLSGTDNLVFTTNNN